MATFNITNNISDCVIRFAPTASGKMHIGNLRVLLTNELLVKKFNLEKKILLRIDFQEGVSELLENKLIDQIKDIMDLFNIKLCLKIIKQRDRFHIYDQILQLLINKNYAYKINDIFYLNVKKHYDDNYIVRFKDMLLGNMYKKITNIKNPIIFICNRNLFLFSYTCVIDDLLLGIKYVVRGI